MSAWLRNMMKRRPSIEDLCGAAEGWTILTIMEHDDIDGCFEFTDEEPSLCNNFVAKFAAAHAGELVHFATSMEAAGEDEDRMTEVDADDDKVPLSVTGTLRPSNATQMLIRALRSGYQSTFDAVVEATVARVLSADALHAVAALNIRRVVCVALEKDRAATFHVARRQLTADGNSGADAVIATLLEHVATQPQIANLALDVVGALSMGALEDDSDDEDGGGQAAASGGTPEQAALNTELFARAAVRFAAHVGTAVADEARQPYFDVLDGFLRRGADAPMQQFVTAMLAPTPAAEGAAGSLVHGIFAAAATFGTVPAAEFRESQPLFTEAMCAMYGVTAVLQVIAADAAFESDLAPAESEQDAAKTAALRAVLQHLPSMHAILQPPAGDGGGDGDGPRRLGGVRLAAAEACMFLHRFHRRDIDAALAGSGFYADLFALAEAFPSHDIFLTTVSEIIRDVTHGADVMQMPMSSIASTTPRARFLGAAASVKLLQRIVAWSTEERYRGTSLRAIALNSADGVIFALNQFCSAAGKEAVLGEDGVFADVMIEDHAKLIEAVMAGVVEDVCSAADAEQLIAAIRAVPVAEWDAFNAVWKAETAMWKDSEYGGGDDDGEGVFAPVPPKNAYVAQPPVHRPEVYHKAGHHPHDEDEADAASMMSPLLSNAQSDRLNQFGAAL
jgi:hypothetical protein